MAAVSQTPAVGVAVKSYAPTAEGSNSVGANRTQGLGITLFLAGFTAFSGGLYSGKVLWYILAAVLIGASVWAFRKIKPLEKSEN
jgi:hypothetical protein